MQQYHQFLQNFLASKIFQSYHIKTVKGDGSHRKIFRVICENKTFILVDSEDKEENQRFIKLSSFLKAQGLNVPEIYHWDSCGSFFLQQDLGEKFLHNRFWSGKKILVLKSIFRYRKF